MQPRFSWDGERFLGDRLTSTDRFVWIVTPEEYERELGGLSPPCRSAMGRLIATWWGDPIEVDWSEMYDCQVQIELPIDTPRQRRRVRQLIKSLLMAGAWFRGEELAGVL
jgi:hypothetical protein